MPEDAFHQALKRARGKASAYSCINCEKEAYEWAYQHNGDPENFHSYSPMCRSCHRKLDLQESPVLQEAWAKSKVVLTNEMRSRGGRNSVGHPGYSLPHEQAVEFGRLGGLAKARNRKEKQG